MKNSNGKSQSATHHYRYSSYTTGASEPPQTSPGTNSIVQPQMPIARGSKTYFIQEAALPDYDELGQVQLYGHGGFPIQRGLIMVSSAGQNAQKEHFKQINQIQIERQQSLEVKRREQQYSMDVQSRNNSSLPQQHYSAVAGGMGKKDEMIMFKNQIPPQQQLSNLPKGSHQRGETVQQSYGLIPKRKAQAHHQSQGSHGSVTSSSQASSYRPSNLSTVFSNNNRDGGGGANSSQNYRKSSGGSTGNVIQVMGKTNEGASSSSQSLLDQRSKSISSQQYLTIMPEGTSSGQPIILPQSHLKNLSQGYQDGQQILQQVPGRSQLVQDHIQESILAQQSQYMYLPQPQTNWEEIQEQEQASLMKQRLMEQSLNTYELVGDKAFLAVPEFLEQNQVPQKRTQKIEQFQQQRLQIKAANKQMPQPQQFIHTGMIQIQPALPQQQQQPQHQQFFINPHTTTALIQPIVIQQNPQFHQNSNQQYYQYQFGGPGTPQGHVTIDDQAPFSFQPHAQHQTQLQSFDAMNPIIRPPSMFHQQLGFNPMQSTCSNQTTSNCSSSGNISSSWLSQSQISQTTGNHQNTPPQTIAVPPNPHHQSPHQQCQCTSCLKSQMAQLQQMLQQQQQLFVQQAQTLQAQSSQLNGASLNFSALPLVPSGQSSFSNQQNQNSSSCWASSTSTSQVSPSNSNNQSQSQSQTVNSNSLHQSYEKQNNNNQQTTEIEMNDSQQKAEIQSQQFPKSESSSPDVGANLIRGNEDETMEERKSESSASPQNNTEEEEDESGSIPDEIEQQCLRSFSDKNGDQPPVGEMTDDQLQALIQFQRNEHQTLEDGGSNPYWVPVQQQIIASQGNMLRKNYIELPMGEIPEMKESFYDEASRWSQVIGTANQSRTKTPDAVSQNSHLQNQSSDNPNQNSLQANNINNNSSLNKEWATVGRSHTTQHVLNQSEEDKDDLFLYSQGESGATFNRTSENDSSFLTTEKNKMRSVLRGAERESHIFKAANHSPSFDGLRALSMSSRSYSLEETNNISNNNMNKNQSSEKEEEKSQIAKSALKAAQQMEHIDITNDQVQMMYPSSTDTKRPPLEYSASSQKYMNQSLTFTPSQNQYNQSNLKSNNDYAGLGSEEKLQQNSISKIIQQYGQTTPVQKNSKRGSLSRDDYEAAEAEVIRYRPTSRINEVQREALNQCKVLDEEFDRGAKSKSSASHSENSTKEILRKSPLPPLPFYTDLNKELLASTSQPLHQESNGLQFSDEMERQKNGKRQGSISYEKEKANKIINYILNSDQKDTIQQSLKSSSLLLQNKSRAGFHRPHVMSQMNHIFPSLDEILSEQEKELFGLRANTHSNNENRSGVSSRTDQFPPSSSETGGEKITLTNEEVLLWTASISSETELEKAKLQQQEDIITGMSILNPPNFSQVKQTKSSSQIKPSIMTSIGGKSSEVQAKQTKTSPQWQSRNLKSQTQNLKPNMRNLSANSVFDFNTHRETASHRIRSLDNESRSGPGCKTSKSDERTALTITIGHQGKISSLSKSPLGKQKKQDIMQQQKSVPIQVISQTSRNQIGFKHQTGGFKTVEELIQRRSSNSHSPYYGDKSRQVIANKQVTPTVQQKKIILKKNQAQNSQGNTVSQTNLNIKKTQKLQQPTSKYSPTIFDRVKQKQVFSLTQKLGPTVITPMARDSAVIYSVDDYNSRQHQTQRANSGKSRNGNPPATSQERKNGSRNSSCSSKGNISGQRKRKFSKIVFEISELPAVTDINRSLSQKRQKNQLIVKKGSIHLSSSSIIGGMRTQQIPNHLIQHSQASISPKRLSTSSAQTMIIKDKEQKANLLQLFPLKVLERPNSYNQSSEFIITHDNFQIKQQNTEEAVLDSHLVQYTTAETNQNQDSSRIEGIPPIGQTQMQSQHSRNAYIESLQWRQAQTEMAPLRVQNLVLDSSNTAGQSSKAIVQFLLQNNENVGSQLSRLFGQRMMSKNLSLISDFNTVDESLVYGAGQIQLRNTDNSQRLSPLNAYPTRQKQLSPNNREVDGNQIGRNQQFQMTGTGAIKKLFSSVITPTQKVCLPNSIFFTQGQGSKGSQKSTLPQNLQVKRKGPAGCTNAKGQGNGSQGLVQGGSSSHTSLALNLAKRRQ